MRPKNETRHDYLVDSRIGISCVLREEFEGNEEIYGQSANEKFLTNFVIR